MSKKRTILMRPRPGESREQFKARLAAALADPPKPKGQLVVANPGNGSSLADCRSVHHLSVDD